MVFLFSDEVLYNSLQQFRHTYLYVILTQYFRLIVHLLISYIMKLFIGYSEYTMLLTLLVIQTCLSYPQLLFTRYEDFLLINFMTTFIGQLLGEPLEQSPYTNFQSNFDRRAFRTTSNVNFQSNFCETPLGSTLLNYWIVIYELQNSKQLQQVIIAYQQQIDIATIYGNKHLIILISTFYNFLINI